MPKKTKKETSKRLKVMVNSNAPWAPSGYGQQVRQFLPLIAKEGYKTACIAFHGLEGGIIEMDGITYYPRIGNPYGDDAMMHHGKHFNTDITISLQDIWTLNPELMHKVTRWCLDGDALVSFTDGTSMKIKELVKNKVNKKVWGYKNNEIVEADILDWQIIEEKKNVYEIKTVNNTILITGENEVFVNNGWKRADSIKEGDVVYSIYNAPHKESDNKKHKTNEDRFSIFSWINRWRGNSNDNEGQEEKPQNRSTLHSSPFVTNNQYRYKDDRVGAGKDTGVNEQSNSIYGESFQSKFRKVNKRVKNLLYGNDMGVQLFTDTGTNISLSNNEKGASKNSNRLYKIKTETTSEKVQPTIYERGIGNVGENTNLEPEIVLAVKKVKAPKRTVYDISTTTENFFANNLLVHNCPIVPIDHEPTPPAIIDRLKLAYRIITYSKFGYNELKKAGLHSTYIPHTVEADIFKPLDKSKLKKEIGIPDDYYVFGMVSANKDNPPRKSFQHVMDAFKAFHDLHPKSCLYFHTLMEQSGGFPLKEYAKALGIEGSIYHTPPYEMLYLVKPEDIANIYNTFDVLLCPSLNEGFGVPIIEAQSCGVPVIANDFTAMRELVENGKTGYKVKQSELRFDPLLSYVGVPDTEDIYNSMIKLYNRSEKEVREMSDNCRNFILENYDLKLVWEKHWKPFLSRLEKEVY